MATSEPKKTLYHSELANMGPVVATVTEGVKESSKKRGSYYVTLLLEGRTRYYTVENEQCGQAFDGWDGQTVVISATGSRENAAIDIEAADEGAQAAPVAPAAAKQPVRPVPSGPAQPGGSNRRVAPAAKAPVQTQAHELQPEEPTGYAPKAPPPVHAAPVTSGLTDEQRVIEAKKFLARNANAIGLAADESLRSVMEFCERHEVQLDKATVATAIAQNMCNTSFTTLYIALTGTWRENLDMASHMPFVSLNGLIAKIKAARAAKGGAQ